MFTVHRPYREEAGDFRRIARFFIDHAAYLRDYSTWSLPRFVDWKYGLYDNKTAVAGFCEQNACLWFDGFDELVGLVISEGGDEGFTILTAPGYRMLFVELLDWVLTHWQTRGPRLVTEISARQTLEAAALTRAGFGQSGGLCTQCFDLRQPLPPPAPLEAGFTIVDMATHPDYRSQRILRDSAFGDRDDLSEEELQRHLAFYNYSHHGPIYHAEVDVCVMAPDGRLVAGCEALLDAHNLESDLERVCTHRDFRRRGFARAAIQACLARLQEMGYARAYITGYSEAAITLYASLGGVESGRGWIMAQQT